MVDAKDGRVFVRVCKEIEMKAINLRTEYLINPIGIDIQNPRLFWNC